MHTTACFACGFTSTNAVPGAQLALAPARCATSSNPYPTHPPAVSLSPGTVPLSLPIQTSRRVRPRARSVILWLGYGSLRLGDCGAVQAVCALPSGDRVLPVAVVTATELPLCSRALYALRTALQRHGTQLVLRVVRDAAAKTCALAALVRRVHAHAVYAPSPVAIHGQGVLPVPLHVFKPLLYTPVAFPPPPHIVPRGEPVPPASTTAGPRGEFHARQALDALAASGAPHAAVARRMAPELVAGTLAECRVRASCLARRRTAPVHCASAGAAGVAGVLGAYDVLGNDQRGVVWDEKEGKFKLQEWEHEPVLREMSINERWDEFVRRRREFLFEAFFPPDVTPDYYAFTAWRFTQRIMSATVGVFGTRALLLALGVKAGKIGQAAAISWVLKDGLGRVGKMIWASGMGRDFDVDPKRWRFRSALLYATGNGLEIVTQVFPASFLLLATAANTLKQVSMLTSSACRNAMYRSFGDKAQNIANITAKGEAQIVVADLIGMVAGIWLSKAVGTNQRNVLICYTLLTSADIFGIYMELRQVVFRTLNPERTNMIIQRFVNDGDVLTPQTVSRRERIFRPPRYNKVVRFSSIAKAASTPEELEMLLNVYRRDRFMVAAPTAPNKPCRVVLRKDAGNEDVVKALITANTVLRLVEGRKLQLRDQQAVLVTAKRAANKSYPQLSQQVRNAGWDTENLLFGTLKRRAYWKRE